MIKNVFMFCLLVFSLTLNILLFMENQKLSDRVRYETLKRMDEKFQRNHPYHEKVDPKYPIVAKL